MKWKKKLRYLKDVGSTPTYNASMYFGRGAYLNGVDQRLEDVLLKEPLEDIGVLCFRVNPSNLDSTYIISNADGSVRFYIRKEPSGWHVGLADTFVNTGIIPIAGEAKDIILAWNSGTFTLSVGSDSYTNTYIGSCAGIYKLTVSSSQRYTPSYFGGVLKDIVIFNRALTQSEITQFYEQPELFYATAQADSTCVLNMPMCETDGYVRNMKSYSKGSELDTTFNANIYSSNALLRVAQFNLGLVVEANKTYLVEIEYDDTANSILTGYICYGEKGDGTYGTFQTELKGIVNGTKGTAFYLLQMPSTYLGLGIASAYAWITTTTSGKTAYISVRSLKELTGIYPITNYTSSVRDNAKNLQYGLQTCKFVRDSLGVIQSASNYLECDGVGYIKTQWIPNGTDVFTLETVITPALVSKLQAHGNYGTSINEVQIGVTASNLVFASSLNSETVYLPYTENMHVCIVSDGVQSYYYCNNVLIKTTYNNSGSTINPFAFGGVNSGTIFNPTYDTLRLFKIHAIAYTSSQVDAAYYALAKKSTIAYDVIPDECLYDENDNVYVDESGNYIGLDGYVVDESGEYYIV
jgi:hypothetical protein